MKENIAVYGGTFDPPTFGHERVASGIIETFENIDRIILLPSGFRDDKNFGTNNEQRALLLKQFHEDLLEQNLPIEIDTHFFEGKNGGKTTTLQENKYFNQVRNINPEFIYGSDIIANMPNWHGNIDTYIERVLRKIFIGRPGYDINPEVFGIENYRIAEIEDIPDVSSSMAREAIQVGESVEGILKPGILQLIEEHQLYKTNK